ncbi:MATE family efflux transporter [Albirhodobacter sp. R86504]|uniref:MATE family efflux transporter n=1 Tax=Albirhodobacter sp. R86504 TaxID=3093848 RepID=UPI0036717173
MTLKAMMTHGIVVIDALLVAGLGEAALAAMGLAGAVGGMLVGTLLAFSSATQIWIAQAYGSGRPIALKTGFYCGLAINVAAGLLGILAVLIFGGDLFTRFAHTPEIAAQAQTYLNAFLFVVLGEAVAGAISSHFNGCGETKTSFYSHLFAVPVNIIVSVGLIHGLWGLPELGVLGAAIGSAVSSLLRAGYLGMRFYAQTGGYFDVAGWMDGTLKASLKRHIRFSLPIAATFISSTFANTASTLLYAHLNVNAFAALTLILPWVNVAGTLGITWAQATGILIGQLLGRNLKGDELDAFLRRAWKTSCLTSALVSFTYLCVALGAGWIYSDLQEETKAALLSFLPILVILPFPKGSNAICGNTLRAGGETVYVMNLFIAAQWAFRIPLTAIMILYLDLSVTWVFSLLLMEELVKFPAFHIRLLRGGWKRGLT